jgi:hypothetical protein
MACVMEDGKEQRMPPLLAFLLPNNPLFESLL